MVILNCGYPNQHTKLTTNELINGHGLTYIYTIRSFLLFFASEKAGQLKPEYAMSNNQCKVFGHYQVHDPSLYE